MMMSAAIASLALTGDAMTVMRKAPVPFRSGCSSKVLFGKLAKLVRDGAR